MSDLITTYKQLCDRADQLGVASGAVARLRAKLEATESRLTNSSAPILETVWVARDWDVIEVLRELTIKNESDRAELDVRRKNRVPRKRKAQP